MGDSIKKFTPYKKIIFNNEMADVVNPLRKRLRSQDTSEVTPPKIKRTEIQASASSGSPSPKVGRKKKDKSKKMKSKEPKLKSKNNKENNTIEDVVTLEDSNDGIGINSTQSDDFVIVLDTNSNVKPPSSGPTVSCDLSSLISHCNAFNSLSKANTLGCSNSSERTSCSSKESLECNIAHNLPQSKKSRKEKCEYSLNKLFANSKMLPAVVDITEDQPKTSSISLLSKLISINEMCAKSHKKPNDHVEIIDSKCNASDVQSPHNGNVTITLDDSIVVKESNQARNSDVLILDNHISKPLVKQDDSVIIDLEVIPSHPASKESSTLNVEPLIVYDKSKDTSQTKPSASLAEWPQLPTTSSNTLTPKLVSLNNKKTKKTKRKEKLGKHSKKVKRPKRLSQVEFKKLEDIRKTIVQELDQIEQREKQPTHVNNFTSQSVNFTSQSVASTSALNGNFSSSRVCFNQAANRPFFIDTNQNRCLLEAPSTSSFLRPAPAPRAQLGDDNMYNPSSSTGKKTGLRPIIIDGSNVAIEFLKYTDPSPYLKFNSKGIQIVVDYFKKRGHKEIHVFIPAYRAFHPNTLFPEILEKLKNEGILHHTPSRRVEGRLQCAYDDRYIVQVACELDGVIVSNDRYRDIMAENDKWKSTIEKRLLLFNFVGELLIFPQDPLGRNGPNLDTFLSF